MIRKQFGIRLSERQAVLVDRVMNSEEWPPEWSQADRLAWILEFWQRTVEPKDMPKVERRVR